LKNKYGDYDDLKSQIYHLNTQLQHKDVNLLEENQRLVSELNSIKYQISIKELEWKRKFDASESETGIFRVSI